MTQTTEDLLAQALKEIQLLKEQVAFLNRKLYGVHSEKMTDPNQLSLFLPNQSRLVVKAKKKS